MPVFTKSVFTLLILLTFSCLQAQNNLWIDVDQNLTENEFFSRYQDQIGSQEFELIKTDQDFLGMTHDRFSQKHNDITVEGAVFILHYQNDLLLRANGNPVKNLNASEAAISKEMAIEKALESIAAQRYSWESLTHEGLKKRIDQDDNATWYPNPELVYANEEYSGNGEEYRLAYKMDIHSLVPHDMKTVFVDAVTSDILFVQNGCVHVDVEGEAETFYHGTRTIITDSIAPDSFRLVDATRGGGIETYNLLENTTPDSAVHFYDADNYWDNVNDQMDEIATDVHWSTEMAYDYFWEEHSRDSYDDEGSTLISYVHYGEDVYNAFWNGSYASYGDGGAEPFTYIDIIGHELAHGVTRTTAGLIYANESGALNESFSDIFGRMVELFGFPEGADWNIGTPGNVLRRMDDPESVNDPDTYLGDYFYLGEFDNGGVHTNSSVQNYWFYLLSDGGEGVNSLDTAYSVAGIGLDNAADVAYRNLVTYLTPSSNHMDARIGSLYSAEDLYGSCSEEVVQVGLAWHAVGVGGPELTHDLKLADILSPNTSCELSDHEELSVRYIYNGSGCNESLEPGDEILAAYEVEGFPTVFEIIPISETINGGDTIDFTFSAPVNLEVPQEYSIKTWAAIDGDLNPLNDSIVGYDIIHINTLEENEVLGYQDEDYVPLVSYNITKNRSEVRISPFAGSSSSRGVQLNGRNLFNPNQIDFPTTEEEIFTLNPNFEAKHCLCMQTEGWENVRLSFDLKQTFSEYYLEISGTEFPQLVSSLRVLVNDETVSPIYHPTTYDDDPFLTHVINLDEYAGQDFEVCFSGVHFLKKEDDPAEQSPGDNSYLDNIFLTSDDIVGVEEIAENSVSMYPNPSNGVVYLTLNNFNGNQYQLEVYNASGQLVYQDRSTELVRELNLNKLSRGVYSVKISSDESVLTEKLILN